MINGPYLSVNFPCSFPPTFSFILSLHAESKLDGRLSLYRGEIITLIIWTNGLLMGDSEPARLRSVRGSKDLQVGGRSSGAGRALKESITSLIWMLFFGSMSLSETAQEGESVDGRI